MNGKKAKLLRRIARAHTVGLPDKEPLAYQHRKTGAVRVEHNVCTRKVYQQHKRTFGGLTVAERAIKQPNNEEPKDD